MSVNNDVVAALPTSGSADKALMRNLLYNRLAYVMSASDVPTDYIAVDPVTGAATIVIIYLGRLFNYDSTDTTTANDGVTCLVSNEGRRYKLSDGNDVFAYSVINNTTSTPPVSPSLGDAYLVASGATGAWAGKANYIATRTIRGWEFINYAIGRFIYVEAIDTYYHRNSSGTWVTGFGAQTTAPNSIPLSAAINFGKRVIVENQTTMSPPGSPVVGTAYVIGASATGAWSGKDLQVAICEVAGTFTIYNPTNGWEIYDKARNGNFTFNGTSWLSAVGVIIDTASNAYTSNTTFTGSYAFGTSAIPQISGGDTIVTLLFTMKSTTNKLRLRFSGMAGASTATAGLTVAFFLNSNANAIAASGQSVVANNQQMQVLLEHEFVPGTTSQITLTVRCGINSGSYVFNAFYGAAAFARLIAEEIAVT